MSQGTGSTRLVVPVAEIAGRVPGAHIALLDPFLPAEKVDEGVLSELGELFADLVPFAFVLGDRARFPDGTAYLPPQPLTVFRRIIQGLRRAFPEVVGPITPFGTVVPHVEVPDECDVPTPLEVHARGALLQGDGGVTIATFPFGTSAA